MLYKMVGSLSKQKILGRLESCVKPRTLKFILNHMAVGTKLNQMLLMAAYSEFCYYEN